MDVCFCITLFSFLSLRYTFCNYSSYFGQSDCPCYVCIYAVPTPNKSLQVFVENDVLYYEIAIFNVILLGVLFHTLNVYVDALQLEHVLLKAHVDNGNCR